MFNIFVNFKTYPQATGEKAEELARACEEASQETKFEITPVVQTADVYRVKQAVKIPVWVQHLDFQPQGKFTGWVNFEAAVEAGASGTLLSHSEHPLPPGTIKQVLARIENFSTMICCKTLGQMERLVKLKPDFIGYEISGLISGQVSITKDNSGSIKHAVEICGKIPLIVGAGINQPRDLAEARELGASGVLISSSVVLAQKPKEKILELISLLKEG